MIRGCKYEFHNATKRYDDRYIGRKYLGRCPNPPNVCYVLDGLEAMITIRRFISVAATISLAVLMLGCNANSHSSAKSSPKPSTGPITPGPASTGVTFQDCGAANYVPPTIPPYSGNSPTTIVLNGQATADEALAMAHQNLVHQAVSHDTIRCTVKLLPVSAVSLVTAGQNLQNHYTNVWVVVAHMSTNPGASPFPTSQPGSLADQQLRIFIMSSNEPLQMLVQADYPGGMALPPTMAGL
jgi:hypothetical protein